MVQAPAFAVAFITELFGKTTSIEVRATFAVFVNQTAIGEGRTVFVIQFRRFAVSDDVRNGREEVVRVRRAARNIDNGFAWQNFLQADCASWVNSSCGNTAPRGAGTNSDNGCCAFRRFADVIHNRLTGNHAINTVIF
ncbi:Uncharacterised protein [Shigella flexneri]|nr:Uncharacterised protein [Shigella flexneri]